VAFSVWMISLSVAPLQEYLLAAGCAIPCGVGAVVARRAVGDSWTLRPGWLRPLLLLPVAVLTDTLAVLRSGLRPQGRVQSMAGPPGAGPVSRSGRAVATMLVSVTPASFVLDAESGIIYHSVAGPGPSMARAVERAVGG
jgi:hypothetical protein